MRRVTRRALGCATIAATGAALLGAAGSAQAQRPEKVGDGIKTGQMSTQMFNFAGYIGNGGNTGPASPIGPPLPTTPAERLERLFGFLQSKGVTSIELFGHSGFPSNTDTAGLVAYRALMDKYGIHAAGWHGSVNETGWDARVAAAKILGADYIGSGGVADPGINSYSAVLASAQALNRLGKKSVEAGVGPVYIHNHQQEFRTQYVDNGVLKTAFDILMEKTDPRYVAAEVDVFWSSDAFQDDTGTQTAALINKWPTRVKMLHVKDGINIAATANGNPRATGTGELDFRPIFASSVNRVQYYHHEHDGGTLTDANTSFTNLKGIGAASVPALLAVPPSFPSVAAGTPAASNQVPVVVQNTGDQPLTITNVQVQADALDAPSATEFQIVSQNCTAAGGGGPLQAGALATDTTAAVPRGTCVVNVGFKPTRTNTTSVARLRFTSNADDATETVLLAARSTSDSLAGPNGDVQGGGNVPSLLQLTIPSSTGSFGTFVPGLARTYDVTMAAFVTSTAGDALLSVADTDTVAPGRLVNGSFALPQALQLRAANAADPNPAYQSIAAANTPLTLKSYGGPVANDAVSLGFRQAIGANDALRAGNYSKALTFSLSTTTP